MCTYILQIMFTDGICTVQYSKCYIICKSAKPILLFHHIFYSHMIFFVKLFLFLSCLSPFYYWSICTISCLNLYPSLSLLQYFAFNPSLSFFFPPLLFAFSVFLPFFLSLRRPDTVLPTSSPFSSVVCSRYVSSLPWNFWRL